MNPEKQSDGLTIQTIHDQVRTGYSEIAKQNTGRYEANEIRYFQLTQYIN